MHSYILIQQIEKELRRNAVDCFINYSRISDKTLKSLDGLPYHPVVSFDKSLDPKYTKIFDIPNKINFSFFADEFSDREVETIIVLIKKLFTIRPVWIYSDLWNGVRNPHQSLSPQYITSYFLENNFKIALQLLINPAYVRYEKPILQNDYNVMFIRLGNSIRRIVKIREYFILVPIDANGCPILDNDIFMKSFEHETFYSVSISNKITEKYNDEQIEGVAKKMLGNYNKNNIANTLIREPTYIHIYLIRSIITQKLKLDYLLDVYIKFGIIITPDQFIKNAITDVSKDPVAYIHCDIVHVYINGEWKKLSTAVLLRKELPENNIIIGYIAEYNSEAVFKLKPPRSTREHQNDMRKVFRGAVCETFSIEYKYDIATKLGIVDSPEDKKDKKNICNLILENLFNRERDARISGVGNRWLYLFNESPKL
jgi:hypothetical protein